MAKYKRRKDGRYCTHIDTGKYDDNGKRVRITVYAKTIKELEDKAAVLRCQSAAGTLCKSSSMTFREYAALWLAGREPTLENATYNIYSLVLKNHTGYIDNLPLNKIVKSDVQECINLAAGKYGIQEKMRLVINQVCSSAMDDNLIPKNPCTGVKLPNHIPNEKRPLTEAEKKAIKYCGDFSDMEAAFIYILYFTGLRRGEALALMKGDINLEAGEIHITKSLAFIDKNKPEIKTPKTKTSIRTVYMPAALKSALKSYMASINSLYLFTDHLGQIMSYSSYNRMWQRIFKKINAYMGGTDTLRVTDLTPHIFRHNYATMLYYQGIDVKQAQKLLGHSNIKTTLEIYTHLISDETVSQTLDALAL